MGLSIQTPPAATEGNFIDHKCPFTGEVVIRGRIMRGIVTSTKMHRTIIIRRDYLQWIRKYKRFEKRHAKIPAHCSPAFIVKEGDIVTIGECRPLSKTVHFNVISVNKLIARVCLRQADSLVRTNVSTCATLCAEIWVD